jgi:hypothetical protein
MKRFLAFLAMMLFVVHVSAQQAKPGMNLPSVSPNAMVTLTGCPAPYQQFNSGVDASKGEYYCIKSAGCPQGFSGQLDQQTGVMTCSPVITTACPTGWSGGAVDGKLVCRPMPQPVVGCPKQTPAWQWGTTYYTTSWNKMGCAANVKPAY